MSTDIIFNNRWKIIEIYGRWSSLPPQSIKVLLRPCQQNSRASIPLDTLLFPTKVFQTLARSQSSVPPTIWASNKNGRKTFNLQPSKKTSWMLITGSFLNPGDWWFWKEIGDSESFRTFKKWCFFQVPVKPFMIEKKHRPKNRLCLDISKKKMGATWGWVCCSLATSDDSLVNKLWLSS